MNLTNQQLTEIASRIFTVVAQAHNAMAVESLPSAKGYDKHIFTLPPRADEQAQEVVIKVKQNEMKDCNLLNAATRLQKTSHGYYVIDSATLTSTRKACGSKLTEPVLLDVRLTDGVVAYDSRTPIVIHSARGLLVSYEVQAKVPAAES